MQEVTEHRTQEILSAAACTDIGKGTIADTDDCSCRPSPDSYADPPACTLIIFLFTAQLPLAHLF